MVLLKSQGSKYFYEHLKKQYDNMKLRQRWSDDLNQDLSNINWDKIYKLCFKTIKGNDLVWFQYRILHRILGTNEYLFKVNKTGVASCSFCKASVETLSHLFFLCPFVSEFWKKVQQWLQHSLGLYIDLEPLTILFGSIENELDFFPKNIIILVAKKFIWTASKQSRQLNLTGFKNVLKIVYTEQEYIAKTSSQSEKFTTSWYLFKDI